MNTNKPQRTFIKKYAKRYAAHVQKQKESRRQLILQIISRTSNLTILLLSTLLISLIWQFAISIPYLTSPIALGKHYFNALTYTNFIARHLPMPLTGWLPFWNEGSPLIGGHPTLFFYLIYPLTKIFDTATSMELVAIVTILFYLIASHFLFWELSRNHLFSLILTGILILNPATYELLVSEGNFSATGIQWFLPAVLFALTRFIKTRERQLLMAAAVFSGIATLTDPPLATATIFIPSFLYLLTTPLREKVVSKPQLRYLKKSTTLMRLKTKSLHLFLFTAVALTIGSFGLFSLYSLYYKSGSVFPCITDFCRGQYPQGFRWFSPLILAPLLASLPTTLLALRISRKRILEVVSLILALTPLLIFPITANLQLVNTLAGIIAPQNIFWSISLLTLSIMAATLSYMNSTSKKLGLTTLATTVLFSSVMLLLLPQLLNFKVVEFATPTLTHPPGVESYIVLKYQNKSTADVFPEWLPLEEKNLRIDSLTPQFASWWNSVSNLPLTRGYSREIAKQHLKWQNYLHFSTAPADPQEEISETTRLNRLLFMLDNFAVRFIQDPHESIAYQDVGYNPSLLADQKLIERKQTVVDSTFIELRPDLTSPIVLPTNASPILVVANEEGYETFIRAISLLNFNSKLLIPIQGSQSIDELDQELLDQVDALVLYQFTGENWQSLEKFVERGGNVFIDVSSRDYKPEQLPSFLGAQSLEFYEKEKVWNLKTSPSELLNKVDTQNFAPLLYKEDPWKIASLPSGGLLPEWLEPVLTQNQHPILAFGKLKDAKIIFSGFNLPFHIVSYNNDNELALLKNILTQLAPSAPEIAEFTVSRQTPSLITVSSTNARGIYSKENYHPGWRAIVNGEKTNLYQAGLGFMYLPLPAELQQKTTDILLEFRPDRITWALTFLTLLGLAFALIYSLTITPFEAIVKLIDRKITRPLKRWWAKEEL